MLIDIHDIHDHDDNHVHQHHGDYIDYHGAIEHHNLDWDYPIVNGRDDDISPDDDDFAGDFNDDIDNAIEADFTAHFHAATEEAKALEARLADAELGDPTHAGDAHVPRASASRRRWERLIRPIGGSR